MALLSVAGLPGVFDEIFNIGLQPVSNYGINRALQSDDQVSQELAVKLPADWNNLAICRPPE